jgi:hypothetical protein
MVLMGANARGYSCVRQVLDNLLAFSLPRVVMKEVRNLNSSSPSLTRTSKAAGSTYAI